MPGYQTFAISALTTGALLASPAVAPDPTCTCSPGTPLIGTDCTSAVDGGDDKEFCSACTSTGYELIDATKKCEKVCTCANGEKLKGAACTAAAGGNDNERCFSCNALTGYVLDTTTKKCKKCASNEYLKNGDTPTCTPCQVGFEEPNENQTKCEKVCTCTNGNKLLGARCTAAVGNGAGGSEFCEDCRLGYRLSNDGTKCIEMNKCHCDRGTEVVGALCWEHGGGVHLCESCEDGYGIGGWPNEAGRCAKQSGQVCSCKHGTGAVGDWCTKSGGGEVCVDCDSPLILSWDAKCRPKDEIKCTCQGGATVDDKSCLSRGGGEACKACGGGFGDKNQQPFEDGSCIKNEATHYAPEEVRVMFSLNLNHASLLADTTGLVDKLKFSVKDALVKEIGDEMTTTGDIQVTLFAGSTVVDATLTMPTNSAARNLANAVKQPAFSTRVKQNVAAINNIPDVLIGEKVEVDTVEFQMTPKPTPAQQQRRPVGRPPLVTAYSVQPAQSKSTTNFPLLGAVAAALFGSGLVVTRVLPRGPGVAPVEQTLVELEEASPLTQA